MKNICLKLCGLIMADINLRQDEADSLISMPKIRENEILWNFPGLGNKVAIPLVSEDLREKFLLDINRGRIELLKSTNQLRFHQSIILVRLDLGAQPHRNPDGEIISGPHIHRYREGYGDKWAQPITNSIFTNPDNNWKTFREFMQYCNIIKVPHFHQGIE